ncbi:uncharacterized protein LOC144434118 [Glandiceps talaboti]
MGGELSLHKSIKNHSNPIIQKINSLHIHSIRKAYYDIKSCNTSNTFIDKNRFINCLDLDEDITTKLFTIFDSSGDGVIKWRECLAGLSLCVCGSLREKSTALFKLFRLSSSKGLTPAVLQGILKITLDAALRVYSADVTSNNGCGVVLLNTEAIVNDIVREIYQSEEYTQEGKLFLAGFQKFVENNPRIPNSMFHYEASTYHKKPKTVEIVQPTLVVQQTSEVDSSEESDSHSQVIKATVIANKAAERLSPTSSTVQTYIWTNVFPEKMKIPYSRSKHAACHHNGCVYLYGGRDVNTTLKDLWKYDINCNVWTLLKCSGDVPPALQEHSMVPYKDKIYIFGGEFGFGSSDETPLWIYSTEEKHWRKHTIDSEVRMPVSRRGHTAVIYNGALHVFGGYVDLKGSTNEFWTYDLEGNSWHLNYDSQLDDSPCARHCHSATVHGKDMWIYGGLANLTAKGDLWKWNFETRRWSRIRYRQGPGDLHGHSVVKVTDGMLVFGGEDGDGHVKNDLWKFTFDTHVWQKLTCFNQISPPPRSRHVAITIATTVNQSPKSERAHSVPNLQGRHKPSMAAISEIEADEKLQRPYSSPPSLYSQESHYFRNRVYPLSPENETKEIKGYHNESFVSDKESENVQLCETLSDVKIRTEEDTGEVLTNSKGAVEVEMLIDLEDDSIDVPCLNPTQEHEPQMISPTAEKMNLENVSSHGDSQCNTFCPESETQGSHIYTEVQGQCSDTTHQTRHQVFTKRSSETANDPALPGVVRVEIDSSDVQEKVISNTTEIDESKIDIPDDIKLLDSDTTTTVQSHSPSQSHDDTVQSDSLLNPPDHTKQLNSWTQGLSSHDYSSQSGQRSQLENSSITQSEIRTENVLKYSHNASPAVEETRPKLHGRSNTLQHVAMTLNLPPNTHNNVPNTDHFVVSGKEMTQERPVIRSQSQSGLT